MGEGNKSYVHDKHFALAKKMVAMGELDLHHEMSVALQAARNIHEFNDIVDKYWAIILQQEVRK
jgi:hypothetical protein